MKFIVGNITKRNCYFITCVMCMCVWIRERESATWHVTYFKINSRECRQVKQLRRNFSVAGNIKVLSQFCRVYLFSISLSGLNNSSVILSKSEQQTVAALSAPTYNFCGSLWHRFGYCFLFFIHVVHNGVVLWYLFAVFMTRLDDKFICLSIRKLLAIKPTLTCPATIISLHLIHYALAFLLQSFIVDSLLRL
jgi:hypothetical protein